MFLPLPLLLGLLVVAAHRELLPPLPGAMAVAGHAGVWFFALLLPAALAHTADRLAMRRILAGREPMAPPRALLRLSVLAVPATVHALYAFGAYGDLVDQLAEDSHLAGAVLGAAPAFLAELPRVAPAVRAATACDLIDELRHDTNLIAPLPMGSSLRGLVRLRLGGLAFVLLPVLALGLGLEAVSVHPSLHVFALATTPGALLGGLLLLFVVVALLPWWFRWSFAVAELPAAVAAPLRAVATALRFPPQRVQLLPTGMRALNAMLIGPLPFGRGVCLTDGIVRELDVDSLAGVVAHEVGHARRGHPTLLMALVVVVPLLLMPALRTLGIDRMDLAVQAAVGFVGIAAAWLVVRALAHRFEHEADVASVAALGAGPCSRALLTVSRLAPAATYGLFARLLSLHPDEPDRWRTMRRYEEEPAFRTSFDRRARAIRVAIGGLVLAAAAAAAWGASRDWPHEHVIWRLYAGDHAGAIALAAAAPPPAEHLRETWALVEQDLAVARAIAPTATDWPAAKAALWPAAWRRGEDVLLAQGPAAARPWLGMALAAFDEATPLQRAVLGWCEAAADGEPERMAELAAIVRAIGVPERLRPAFAE